MNNPKTLTWVPLGNYSQLIVALELSKWTKLKSSWIKQAIQKQDSRIDENANNNNERKKGRKKERQ